MKIKKLQASNTLFCFVQDAPKALLFFIAFCFFIQTKSQSNQCLSIFSDMQNQPRVFVNGEFKFLEPQPIQSFKVGKNSIAYVNNLGRMKLFYGDKSYVICEVPPIYYMTDNWFVYQNYSLLAVLFQNEMKVLDRLAGDSTYVGDSLVVWQSSVNEEKIFYEGKTTLLEQWPITMGKMSDNIFAYTDLTNNFKIFYHGEKITLEGYVPTEFWVDRDIVVYIDNQGNYKYFYFGNKIETNVPRMPQNWIGERFFVYNDFQNRLTVWYKGEEKTLLQDKPKELLVKENMIVYGDKGNSFHCWYKGEDAVIERYYIPKEYSADNDLLVYKDLDGRLRGYFYGKPVMISDQIVKTFTQYNESVMYTLPEGETRIWCNEKTFSYSGF